MSRTTEFHTIRSEGGLLPPDLLRRVLDPKGKLEGTRPEDYGLAAGERLNEAITQCWNRLKRHWSDFRSAAAHLPSGEAGTGLTNDKWTLPLLRELGFGLLPATAGPEIGGRTYAINRFLGPVPIHLVGCGVSLDRRAAGVRGAAAANPHGLVQELLNRSDGHLWAIVSNGVKLRVLRDNQALSRQSFLEFDIDAMFDGEVFSDFVLLWLIAHATRFLPRDGNRPETCWLEQWTKIAEEQGTRALGDLRLGVQNALQNLGQGFTEHPRNTALRDALRSGQVPLVDFHGQLLRVVYRLIFLFVAEDRPIDGQPLLHPRDDSQRAQAARERYAEHYGTGRLRELAGAIKGSRHGDLWRQFQVVVGAVSGDEDGAKAREYLALPVLGSFLWDLAATSTLNDAELTNHDFLEALRDLAFTRQGKMLRPVDYRSLGAEELGGVYESLLALTPQISADGARFTFAEFAGNERKTSGSYYTPDSLVQCLLDSALDPVVEEAVKGKTGPAAEKAILALKVCDPAVGSGHFLVGAAHRLARHLARVRANTQGESEPSPLLYQHALRDVIGRCLYGVDINPMAAELCRVSLWLEALEPGKPLSFLDHHVRVGNSLLGATPELIADGIPDEAFTPIEGDDRKACAVLKKRNKAARKAVGGLFAEEDTEIQARLARAAAALEDLPDERPEDIRAKDLAFHRHEEAKEYRQKKEVADAWCAAFVIDKYFRDPGAEASVSGITQRQVNDLAAACPLPTDVAAGVQRLSDQYQFFHWHLAFPEVFARGGFDCVLGNPPWERVKLQEQEFFSSRSHEISAAVNAAARKALIAALPETAPQLWADWCAASREAEGNSHLVRHSGRYPQCGKGDVNTYSVFAEHNRAVLGPRGRAGFIVPPGLATDDTTKAYFQDLTRSSALVSLYEFENEEFLFPGIDHRVRFILITVTGSAGIVGAADLSFGNRQVAALSDPSRHFSLRPADIALLNPNTRTCPTFRSRRDADLNLALYRRSGVLWKEDAPDGNPWGLRFIAMFHMANDSGLFRTRAELQASGHTLSGNMFTGQEGKHLPLIEAKMVHHFDHRFGTYEGQTEAQDNQGKLPELDASAHADADRLTHPYYWVSAAEVDDRLAASNGRGWLLGWRDISRRTDQRTVIASLIPRAAVGHTTPLVLTEVEPHLVAGLYGNLCSFVLDYAARQKVGGTHLTYAYLKQLPVLAPQTYRGAVPWDTRLALRDWLLPGVLELTYTAWDLDSFAHDVGCDGPPFRWDAARRFLLRCELDAAFFHLCLPAEANGDWRMASGETAEDLARLKAGFPTPRDAAAHIMDTFPIVRKNDEKTHGEYRTKRMILEIYDEMQAAIASNRSYQTRLDPPPADERVAHKPKE